MDHRKKIQTILVSVKLDNTHVFSCRGSLSLFSIVFRPQEKYAMFWLRLWERRRARAQAFQYQTAKAQVLDQTHYS